MGTILNELSRAFNNIYSGWILWNLFLALIPLLLSFWLYRRPGQRSPLWWLGFVVYAAFLPNTAYLLTDIIHLIRGIRLGFSAYIITLVFVPLHTLAILLGFESYVMSLLNQGQYLRHQGAKPYVLWAELLTHALCAVGIFIGRFRRFNSWDLVVEPDTVFIQTLDDLTSKRPLFVMFVTFIVLTVLYWIMKQLTLGLILRIRYAQAGKEIEL